MPDSSEKAQQYVDSLIEEYTEALASGEPISLKELYLGFFEKILESQVDEIKNLKSAIETEIKVLKYDLGFIEDVRKRRVILERIESLEKAAGN